MDSVSFKTRSTPPLTSVEAHLANQQATEMDRSLMFQYVKNMNEAFGNPEGSPHYINWERLRSQCKNIKSEQEEAMSAIALNNVDEVRDALCDIMVFTLGAYHFMGLEADDDMVAVLDGVMTRFCATQQELDDTADKYAKLGVDYTVHGAFPRVYLKSARNHSAEGATDEYPKGKFLKSVGYRLAVLPPLPENLNPSTVGDMQNERQIVAAKREDALLKRRQKLLEYANDLLRADNEPELNGLDELKAF
jgi:hypothetical protein